MKPWGRLICIFLAYGITLLHTAIPHHHPQPGQGEPVVHNGCALPHQQGGLLQRVFSTDLGIGHLETFKKSTDGQIKFSYSDAVVPSFSRTDLIPAAAKVIRFFSNNDIAKRRLALLLSATSFRGPPAL